MKVTPKNIDTSIKNLTASLIGKGICTDSNFSFERDVGKGVEVTFTGAENISFSLKNIAYMEIYKELNNKRSFNMKFIDGSLLQMMYFFKEGYLLQHRLAFYPSPELPSFQDEEDSYMQDELFVDIIHRKIIPFPLRFDFCGSHSLQEPPHARGCKRLSNPCVCTVDTLPVFRFYSA